MAYLTKSRFKIALACPTRLEYALDSKQYHNANEADPFMQALADGGHQVGALAKLHYPNGQDCTERGTDAAFAQTQQWLDAGETVIFEAALKAGHKFIRVDVLELTPNEIRIIEVKAKGLDGDAPGQFFGKRGGIDSGWRSYLEDVAFQVEVARDHFASRGDHRPVRGFLMGPDKNAEATESGLHQHFLIREVDGRNECIVRPGTTLGDLGEGLMARADVSRAINDILTDPETYDQPNWACSDFRSAIRWFEELHLQEEQGITLPMIPPIWNCRKCPYHTSDERPKDGRESGRRRCFEHHLGWTDSDFAAPKVWDIHRAKSKWAEEGKWLIDDLTMDDLDDIVDPDEHPAGEPLHTKQRQWTQIAGSQSHNRHFGRVHLDRDGLKAEIDTYHWPLHLIDFETTAPALPFFTGYSPYEGLPFQFSHHILHRDGRVEHTHEFLGRGQGEDPTFEFARQLCDALSSDNGSVFMFSHHENTYLRYARRQLLQHSPYPQAETDRIVRFIESIAAPSKSNPDEWVPGDRQLIDLAKTVRKWFWHPSMGGSNSIKKVLPAVLEASPYLESRYATPRYGTADIPSLNFNSIAWFRRDANGKVMDPYAILPEIQVSQWADTLRDIEVLYDEERVADGGAAMTAWAYMQFAEMSNTERDALCGMLKQYCELDTLAMVMILEFMLDEST